MKKTLLFLILILSAAICQAQQVITKFPQPEIQYDTNALIRQGIEAKTRFQNQGQIKNPVLFYLYSESVPDQTLKNIFRDAKKIKTIPFYGVVRGFSGEGDDALKNYIQKQVNRTEAEEIETKMDPYVFRELNTKKVPALAYGACTNTPVKCEYYAIIYGDSELEYMVSQIAKAMNNDPLMAKVLKELTAFR